jgi:hypothetical protein
MIDPTDAADQLAATAPVIAALVRDTPVEAVRWKPTPADWSVLEVITHLADEEREDFRTRVEVSLFQPGVPPPPIDPQGWVTARRYNERDPAESLARFLSEREQSLAWLRGLGTVELTVLTTRPPLRAGDLLAAWVAHDLLHLRQLIELRYAWTAHTAAPFTLGYAGDW